MGRGTIWSGWATAADAVRLASEAVARWHLEQQRQQAAASTVGALLDSFVAVQRGRVPGQLEAEALAAHKGRRISPATLTMYEGRCQALRERIGLVQVADLAEHSAALLALYALDREQEDRASQRTIALELRVLGGAWRWAQQAGRAPRDRVLDAPTVQVTGHVANHYTPSDAELARVLEQLEGDHRLLMWAYIETGARVGELAGAPIRIGRGDVLHIEQGKTGPRPVPVGPELAAALRDRLDRSESDRSGRLGAVGASGRELAAPANAWGLALRRACDQAGVPRFTTHGIRRAAVARLRRAGVQVRVAADLLGHSVEVMLRMYDEATPEDLAAAQAKARAGWAAETAERGVVVAGPWE